MMGKRILFCLWICVILLPLVSAGCAGGQVKKTVTVSILPEDSFARDLLDMVFARYRAYTRAGFEEVVSREFTPVREDFLNVVEGKAYAARLLEMNYVIEKGLRTVDKVVIDFSWTKRVAAGGSGAIAKKSGQTEFTFKKTGSGWGLLQVSGDDPF